MLSNTNNKSVALREQKLNLFLERRKALLQIPQVSENLPESDFIIANAGVATPIHSIPENDLIPKIANTAKGICRDLGVRDWKNPEVMKYTATRFMQILKKHYKDLTIQEVKLAFEMAMIGDLDEWLPKDKDGNPDSNHYQEFNVQYYTRILKAFKARKNRTWIKVGKLKPILELPISQEDRKKNRDHFINEIYETFDRYKEKKFAVNFMLDRFYQEFVDQGLFESPEPTKETIDKAFTQYIFSNPNRNERKRVSESYHLGHYLSPLMKIAKSKQGNLAIGAYFDKLITEGKDIRDFLKK